MRKANQYGTLLLPAFSCLVCSCSAPTSVPDPPPPNYLSQSSANTRGTVTNVPYARSPTRYEQGSLVVSQPDIVKKNKRNLDGIRVAGGDTDIDYGWWDAFFRLNQSDTSRLFTEFDSKYKDLQVYGTNAELAALASFERWLSTKNDPVLLERFRNYWNQRGQ